MLFNYNNLQTLNFKRETVQKSFISNKSKTVGKSLWYKLTNKQYENVFLTFCPFLIHNYTLFNVLYQCADTAFKESLTETCACLEVLIQWSRTLESSIYLLPVLVYDLWLLDKGAKWPRWLKSFGDTLTFNVIWVISAFE